MADLLLFQTNDGGEVEVVNGFVTLTSTLETAAYLSLFGGDEWFANALQETEAAQINSLTGRTINETEPSSAGLLSIEDAARQDLAWMVTEGLASSVDAEASLAGSTLTLEVTIEYDNGDTLALNFETNWEAARGRA